MISPIINDARKRKVTSGRISLISLNFFYGSAGFVALRVEMPVAGARENAVLRGLIWNAGQAFASVFGGRSLQCRGLAIHGSIAYEVA